MIGCRRVGLGFRVRVEFIYTNKGVHIIGGYVCRVAWIVVTYGHRCVLSVLLRC